MRIRYALAMGFTLVLLGCGVSSTSNTAPSDATSSTSTGAGSELSPEQLAGTTLVVLKVPNMTWGGCAASVRGDLSQIPGIVDIKTDTENQICSFRVPKADQELKTKLDELAKSNSHMEEFTVVEGLN